MTDDELKQLVGSLAVDSKELREAQKKTDEQMKRIYEQLNLIDEQLQLTTEQKKRTDGLESIDIQLNNMSMDQGDIAKEFFFNSLVQDNHLGPIHFDDIIRGMQKHRGGIQEEYGLVMTNGEAVGIIEVKYKAHQNDLDKLERKMRHFKKLFPIYGAYKLYGAIASFHINDDAKLEALERGFFVLQRSGEVVHTDCSENLMVL